MSGCAAAHHLVVGLLLLSSGASAALTHNLVQPQDSATPPHGDGAEFNRTVESRDGPASTLLNATKSHDDIGDSCGGRLPWCRCSAESVVCHSVSYTRRLSGADIESLVGRGRGVRSLVLTDAAIGSLGAEPSLAFPRLEDVSISICRVRSLSEGAFDRLNTTLARLHLANNHLQELAPLTFAALKNLTELDLGENLLTSLPPRLFHGLHSLVRLNLTGNRLRSLHPDQFQLSVPRGDGQSADVTVTGGDQGASPESNSTVAPRESSSGNGTRATSDLGQVTAHLEYIDLSFNELTYVPARAFRGLRRLATVDLRRNLLITLDEAVFAGLPSLTLVHVSHNPFDCHCGLSWLALELRGLNGANTSGSPSPSSVAKNDLVARSPFASERGLIKCARPTRDADTPLTAVAALTNSFACAPPTATARSVQPAPDQPAYQRSRVSLACEVRGNPTPSVAWRLPTGVVLTDPSRAQYLHDNVTDTTNEPAAESDDNEEDRERKSELSDVAPPLTRKASYRIVATGDLVTFEAAWTRDEATGEDVFALHVDSLRGVSQGEYACVATGPRGGLAQSLVQVTLTSPVASMYIPSLVWGAVFAGVFLAVGLAGGAISACIDNCGCCECCGVCRMSGSNLHYLKSDSSLAMDSAHYAPKSNPVFDSRQRDNAGSGDSCSYDSYTPRRRRRPCSKSNFPGHADDDDDDYEIDSDEYFSDGVEAEDSCDSAGSVTLDETGPPSLAAATSAYHAKSSAGWPPEPTMRGPVVPMAMGSSDEAAMLGEDEKLLQESGDLLQEMGLTPDPLTPDGETQQRSPGLKLGESGPNSWRTLEALEALRLRLKARVEQMDVAKAKMKARMERRAERVKVNMERRAERMRTGIDKRKEKVRHKMQTIRTYSSQSLQTIKETSSNYAHKLQVGVRSAVENVGHTVQSLKEFCGTGDPLGQTVSVATIITDVDTEESVQVVRNVTMV